MAYFKLAVWLLLCVPQVFLPLVHAHVGGERAPGAVHLPGLERYSHPDGPELSGGAALPAWEGAIVRSDDGLRREPVATLPWLAILPSALPSRLLPAAFLPPPTPAPSPPPSYLPSPRPRAPPA
ncbi:hypothetical protein JCM13664_04650 [Methylothermus subterraneus]